jgi:hypothetical protein
MKIFNMPRQTVEKQDGTPQRGAGACTPDRDALWRLSLVQLFFNAAFSHIPVEAAALQS